MIKQRLKIFIMSIIVCAFLALIGTTYAYYRVRIVENNNETSINVTTKTLAVEYEDGSAVFDGNKEFILPGQTFTKYFKVNNTGNDTAYYSIILDNLNNTFERNQDWEYTLYLVDESTNNETELDRGIIAVGTHQVLIASRELTIAKQTEDYKLYLTYVNSDEEQNEDMGETLSFRINISDETNSWDNPKEGTLLSALKKNQPTGNEETIPGQEASKENEARILETEDDYGTSYVYRGNVQNNYVTYSNMCWRIVRVQGDGTIKLALADTNHPCGTANGYDLDDTDSAFIDDENDIARIDIAYKGTVNNNETDILFENSDIRAILNDWSSDNNLDTSKLVETEWCNDTAKTSIVITNNVYHYSWYHVGAFDRLNSVMSAKPSLKCNTQGMEGSSLNVAKATRYKNVLGILSADEVAFAGSTNWYYNETTMPTWDYYLKINATGIYLTSSPAVVNTGNYSNIFIVDSVGCLIDGDVSNNYYSIRPSVILNANVKIEDGGNGLMDTPYVIK